MPMHDIPDQTERSASAKKAGAESTATVRSSAPSVDTQDMILSQSSCFQFVKRIKHARLLSRDTRVKDLT